VWILDASIDWVEAEGNYVPLHAGDQVHLMRETMSGLIDKIGGHRFFRIHRSRSSTSSA
jgi:two-component system LytT family response regulator